MIFCLNWPSGFRGEDFWKILQTNDGRRTPSGGNSSTRWAKKAQKCYIFFSHTALNECVYIFLCCIEWMHLYFLILHWMSALIFSYTALDECILFSKTALNECVYIFSYCIEWMHLYFLILHWINAFIFSHTALNECVYIFSYCIEWMRLYFLTLHWMNAFLPLLEEVFTFGIWTFSYNVFYKKCW